MKVRQIRKWAKCWETNILTSAQTRHCEREMGERLGWLVSPILNGCYYGYLLTGDTRWVAMLIDWADAVIRRGVREPDGYLGWPKPGGAFLHTVAPMYTDNQLGEAMVLHPMVLMADTIRKTPSLWERYAAKAEEYLVLAEHVFAKWDARGCWRDVEHGGVWVAPPFGIDRDRRWLERPGGLWIALLPYDKTLRQVFEANHDPTNWGGLTSTPRYLCWLHAQRLLEERTTRKELAGRP